MTNYTSEESLQFDITKLVPKFIMNDRNGYAIAKAIEAALLYFSSRAKAGLAAITDTENMPEWRLDEMAWELDVGWYDYSADIETKRAVIAGAEEFYNRLGTPSAVESAISATFDQGAVSEWFEYGGEPYHFQVRTSDVTLLTTKRAKFFSLLEQTKNVRSVLDNVFYEGDDRTEDEYAAAGVGSISCTMTATAQRRE